MILTVNIGNTNIRMGIFDGDNCFASWVLNTKPERTEDEYAFLINNLYSQYGINPSNIEGVVIGSVVPPLTTPVAKALEKIHQLTPLVVNRQTPSGVQHTSKQMGTDLYANAVAANYLYQGKKIVVDFGTALTFIAIDESGKVLGVIIAPGVNTSLHALIGDTAQLPEIELKKPKSVLGHHTVECMQSGMVYGFLSMVEGIIQRIKEELSSNFTVISTGGLGHAYAPLTHAINANDTLHTIKGLKILYDINTKKTPEE